MRFFREPAADGEGHQGEHGEGTYYCSAPTDIEKYLRVERAATVAMVALLWEAGHQALHGNDDEAIRKFVCETHGTIDEGC